MQEQSYSYKPAPRFFGDGPVYLGVELEVEAPSYEAKQAGLAAEDRPGWCYAKRDGSLSSTGWEMVTHPISLAMWMGREEVASYHNVPPGTVLTARYKGQTYTAIMREGGQCEWNGTVYRSISAAATALQGGKKANGYRTFGLIPQNGSATARRNANPGASFFALVRKLRALGYDSHNNGRCGFHVHVSRAAFSNGGNLHNPRFFGFKAIVNGALFRKLSQRSDFQFCQQEPVSLYDFDYTRHRYSAVNITSETVEVRIFRGNMREDRLRKNLEAVIAAVEWCQTATTYTLPTDDEFVAYVRERAERFPNLLAFIDEIQSAPEGSDTATTGGI